MVRSLSTSASKILFQYVKDHKVRYVVAIAMMLFSILAQVQIPPVIGDFADEFQAGRLQAGDPMRYALRITGWAILYVVFHWMAIFTIHSLARGFEYHMRNRLFAHWETLSQSYYTHESVGNLMAYATNDVQAVRSSISMGLNQLTNASFTIVATVTAMVGTIDWRLAVYSLLPLPLVTVAVAVLRPQIRHRFRRLQEGFATLSERTQESLSGIRVVKAYVQEEHEIERFEAAAADIVRRGFELTRVSALIGPLIQLVGGISFLISLGYGAVRVIRGDLEFGALVAFNTYLTFLINPMRQIGSVIDVSQRASAALNRLTRLLQERPGVRDVENPIVPERVRGEIEFRNLTFRYPYAKEPALKDINLRIDAGKTVAILGRTASGKTTLVNLLVRAFEPPRGTLFIDGHDIRDIQLAALRRNVAYVPQDVFLFSTTIAENIAFGVEEIDYERVIEAARQAQVYEDIMAQEEGFERMLGERGTGLSGGQRQRVSLARALIKKAPILILDDSLSAVDTNTEAAILEELRKMRGQQTVIVIAHRISTVRDADEIIVLDEGQIVERGTHEELLAKQGLYYEIHELQRRGTATPQALSQAEEGGDDHEV